jgi:hypothetical protein
MNCGICFEVVGYKAFSAAKKEVIIFYSRVDMHHGGAGLTGYVHCFGKGDLV